MSRSRSVLHRVKARLRVAAVAAVASVATIAGGGEVSAAFCDLSGDVLYIAAETGRLDEIDTALRAPAKKGH